MKWLQKLGKALMLPVACLPICGILMGIGYLLCPSTMQGGDVVGFAQTLGFFLVKAGGALIDNIAILFVIGVGVGMSDKNDGTGRWTCSSGFLADDDNSAFHRRGYNHHAFYGRKRKRYAGIWKNREPFHRYFSWCDRFYLLQQV